MDAAREPASPTRGERADETVMVVDDEEMVRRLAAHMLRQAGYSVVEAADGTRCLELVASGAVAPDLLLTDVVMPGIDGWGLSAEVSRRFPRTRVLYNSGNTSSLIPERSSCQTAGFIQKPFTARALLAAVCEALHESRKGRFICAGCSLKA